MTLDEIERLQRVCADIADDMDCDTLAFDGRPFTGRIVGEQMGNQAAAIKALADLMHRVLQAHMPE